jgi:uncharacterized protein YdeI (YjbR/CyaY-like superfamily)
MENERLLYVATSREWRSWLEQHHDSCKEIWLVYYKKHTRKPSIPYVEAVEEAICFGWIDSTIRRIDDEKYAQKFTPRNASSQWSLLNIERAKKLIKSGRMTEAGLKKYHETEINPHKIIAEPPMKAKPVMHPLFLKALQENADAQQQFNSFPPSYQKLCLAWINNAVKEETLQRRINEVVSLSAEGKRIGMK